MLVYNRYHPFRPLLLALISSPVAPLYASRMSTSTRKAKSVLRKKIRSSLSSLTPAEVSSQSSNIFERLFQLPEYQAASSVGLFLSMPEGEIKTDEACRRVLSEGKNLFVPRVGLDFEQCDMELIRVPSTDVESHGNEEGDMFYSNWPKNKWNIPEAPINEKYTSAAPGDIDLLIVPGLGFDKSGGRLGQGKGYYDRFIHKMRSNQEAEKKEVQSKPLLVAVAMEPSLLEAEDAIPMMEHDFRMDMIISPNESITVKT